MNVYAIRTFREGFGDILDVVELLSKISVHTTITEEINPYQHYHIMICSNKTLSQVKKFLYNHKQKKIRQRNDMNVQVCQNIPAYRKYILKDFIRGYDSITGWLLKNEDYLYDFEDLEPEAQHYWEFQQAIDENNNHVSNITNTLAHKSTETLSVSVIPQGTK